MGRSRSTPRTKRPPSAASSPSRARRRVSGSTCLGVGVAVRFISIGWSRVPAWINRSTSSRSWLRQKQRSGLRPRVVKALTASTTTHPSSSAPPMGPASAASAPSEGFAELLHQRELLRAREDPAAEPVGRPRDLPHTATGGEPPLDLGIPIHCEPPSCHAPLPVVVSHDGTGPNRPSGGSAGGSNPGSRWSQSAKSGGAYPRKSGGPNPGNRLVPIRGNPAYQECTWGAAISSLTPGVPSSRRIHFPGLPHGLIPRRAAAELRSADVGIVT
jgi:hypothetical protein